MRMRYLSPVLFLAALSCGGGPTSQSGGGNNGGGNNTGAPPLQANVTVQDYYYQPATIRVKVGGTITWSNHGVYAHTVTGSAPLTGAQLVGGSNNGYGMNTGGGTFMTSFSTAGTFTYHCANHAQMTGTIEVVP